MRREFIRGSVSHYALPDAIQRHLEVTAFHTNRTSSRWVVVVVVGKATAPASNDEPHVIARAAVPVIAICNLWSVVGVPDRFVVNEVISTA